MQNITNQGRQVVVHKATDAEFEQLKQSGARMVEVDRNAIQKMPVDRCEFQGGRLVQVQKGTEADFRKAAEGHRTVQLDKSQIHRGFSAMG